ncbi:MlaD family protein [Nocardia callitridis]|uniref:MlaD family protein n=1 Tax=Nocardia callitridis TaxID=648753 RepID=A0ABP9KAE1_9NOCA
MSYRRFLIVPIVFVLVSVAMTWTVYATLQRGVHGETNSYSAVFTDVSGLSVGDDVRMAGVRVGRVEAIELDATVAVVRFALRGDQVLYGNTLASITYQNLIGQRYLGLAKGDFGDSRILAQGTRIPVEHTEPSFDLSRLLNGFEPLFSMLQPRQVDNITTAVIRGLQGDDGAITALIAETATLARSFAGPDQILGTVIDNLGQVVTELARQSGSLQTTIQQTRKIFDGLDQQRDTLFDQVGEISTVLDRAARVVASTSGPLREFVTREPGFSQHFLDNKDEFAYLGYNIPLLLKSLARIVDTGAYLNAYVCDISVSIIPGVDPLLSSLLGAATPGGQPQHSAICR